MSEKPESDDYVDEDDEGVADGDADLSSLLKDLEQKKRKPGAKLPEPAWRRLERYREDRETAERISDFEDYDIDDESSASAPGSSKRPKRHPG